MSITRIIIAKVGDIYRVDALIGGKHAQMEYHTPVQARQAAIDMVMGYGEGQQDPAEILNRYKEGV